MQGGRTVHTGQLVDTLPVMRTLIYDHAGFQNVFFPVSCLFQTLQSDVMRIFCLDCAGYLSSSTKWYMYHLEKHCVLGHKELMCNH